MVNSQWIMLYKPILQHFQIEPYYLEESGKVMKVKSNKGTFALKSIPAKTGANFIRYIQLLYQKGYNRIVPVYPTVDGRYTVLYNQKLYYLMPWMPDEVKEDCNERHQQLFRELARFHTLSVKDIDVSEEDRTEHYENTKEKWEKEKEFLDEMVEKCEEKWYMSPFELQFCTVYYDISQALNYSLTKLKEWYQISQEVDKVRTVITHGKISTEHFLYDEKGYGYFINLENAKIAPPFHDLLPFISRTQKSYPRRNDDCVDWLYTYFKYFPLKNEEMSLFLSYLSHPGSIFRIAERYFMKVKERNEYKDSKQLLKSYWQFKNIEYIVMKIEEIERQKKQAQEEASQ